MMIQEIRFDEFDILTLGEFRSTNWEPEQNQVSSREPDQRLSTASGLPQALSLKQCEPVMICSDHKASLRSDHDTIQQN